MTATLTRRPLPEVTDTAFTLAEQHVRERYEMCPDCPCTDHESDRATAAELAGARALITAAVSDPGALAEVIAALTGEGGSHV